MESSGELAILTHGSDMLWPPEQNASTIRIIEIPAFLPNVIGSYMISQRFDFRTTSGTFRAVVSVIDFRDTIFATIREFILVNRSDVMSCNIKF